MLLQRRFVKFELYLTSFQTLFPGGWMKAITSFTVIIIIYAKKASTTQPRQIIAKSVQ